MTGISNERRIAKLRDVLDTPLLVTGPKNLAYLTGFVSSNAALLVGPESATLFADARYTAAGREVPDVEFVETARVLLADLANRLQGPIGFETDHISYNGYQTLAGGGLELVPTRGCVERLRAIKDASEIEAITKASEMADIVLAKLIEEPWTGRSERELAQRLRMLVLEQGGDDVAFDVIVGSGPNGAKPHSRPSERFVALGDLVIVDFGVLLNGYRSDLTRTIEVGEIDAKSREILEVCERAYAAALEQIGPGMSGVEADAVARGLIAAAGYGSNFGHALGHGIGIEVHEAPTISAISTDSIAPGQVVMIEPGIYIPGHAGARIEDLCVVHEDGLERITSLPSRISVT
jgi:Xaa-Pro aminopeptidase